LNTTKRINADWFFRGAPKPTGYAGSYNTRKETDKCLPVMPKELGFRTILPLCPLQDHYHRREYYPAGFSMNCPDCQHFSVLDLPFPGPGNILESGSLMRQSDDHG
jgi:hypothetical protein